MSRRMLKMRDSRGIGRSTSEAVSRQSQVPAVTLQRSLCLKECRLLKKIYACLSADLHSECGCTQSFAVAAAGIRLLVERLELDR